MTPIGLVLALVAGLLAGARNLAARYDEVVHAPATEADRVFRWDGEICTPRTCVDDDISMCCVYITHTLHPRHRFAKTAADAAPTAPATLTRDEIRTTMSAVAPRVGACRDTYPARGHIAVRVTVTPAGDVETAAVDPPSGDEAFDACIGAAVGVAQFPRSDNGVRFRYPIPR